MNYYTHSLCFFSFVFRACEWKVRTIVLECIKFIITDKYPKTKFGEILSVEWHMSLCLLATFFLISYSSHYDLFMFKKSKTHYFYWPCVSSLLLTRSKKLFFFFLFALSTWNVFSSPRFIFILIFFCFLCFFFVCSFLWLFCFFLLDSSFLLRSFFYIKHCGVWVTIYVRAEMKIMI